MNQENNQEKTSPEMEEKSGEIEQKLQEIFSTIFGLPKDQSISNASMNTIEKWSSLMHLKLVALLEQNFHLTFDEEEVLQLTSFRDILKKIKNKKGLA